MIIRKKLDAWKVYEGQWLKHDHQKEVGCLESL